MKHVVGLDADNGSVLWNVDFPGKVAVIPTPVFHDGQVYVTAGYGVGCLSFKVGANNAITGLYTNKVMKNHHGGVVLVDGHVYGHSDGAGWTCQNLKTGEEVWSEKSALRKGAVAYADGMLYCPQKTTEPLSSPMRRPRAGRNTVASSSTPRPRSAIRRAAFGRTRSSPAAGSTSVIKLLHCYDAQESLNPVHRTANRKQCSSDFRRAC